MQILFYKYQGTGNDFIIVDNRQAIISKNDTKLIRHYCDRKFGIGADGFILLENDNSADFKMVYFNADGNESSMCGNGGRCIVAFAKFLNLIGDSCSFTAIDGLHHATITKDIVKLQMQDVSGVQAYETHTFLNTGSPHHVQFEANIDDFDIKKVGASIRYEAPYFEEGSNVNFVSKISASQFRVRTYERGVEDETLSCGTGVTAVAIAMHASGETDYDSINLDTEGGPLSVSFKKQKDKYTQVYLKGPAVQVFKGEMKWIH